MKEKGAADHQQKKGQRPGPVHESEFDHPWILPSSSAAVKNGLLAVGRSSFDPVHVGRQPLVRLLVDLPRRAEPLQ